MVADLRNEHTMTDALVVGAGPTGLALAAQVHAHGGRVRIVERRLDRAESRAFIVQPRTLEVLDPLGVTEELIARGRRTTGVRIRTAGRSASVGLVGSGLDDTAYPFLLAAPQVVVEAVLDALLGRMGIHVERGVELISFTQRRDGVECVLRGPSGRDELADAAYVVGCDGADSTVRRTAAIPFACRPYRSTVLLADLAVEGELETDAVNAFIGAPGILFLFPSPGPAPWRLLTVSPSRHRDAHDGERPDLAALQAITDRFTGGALRLGAPTWTRRITLRRAQAQSYRRGRALVAGDAAHLHSPAGAQGMNTGIQDACNLGWKLGLVASAGAAESLLDTYEVERRPVARRVRRLTDVAFAFEASDVTPLPWIRGRLAPSVISLLDDRILPPVAFRLLGGLLIGYRTGRSIRFDRRRGHHPGDRLANGQVLDRGELRRLHEVLHPPGFHLLLCGRAADVDEVTVDRLRHTGAAPLGVHRLGSRSGSGMLVDPTGALLRRLDAEDTAVYLVRPDGYVALRSRVGELDEVARHLAQMALLTAPNASRAAS